MKLTSFDGNRLDIYKLLNAAIMTHLSVRQTIEMHASLVDRSNKGLMFLGPSGIGKTTQAELWMKYRDAEIINGDMVFVKQGGRLFPGMRIAMAWVIALLPEQAGSSGGNDCSETEFRKFNSQIVRI